MRLQDIADGLTLFINNKYPGIKGFFIGKESIEPTKLNAYKAYKVEIYWHASGKNKLIFSRNEIARCVGITDDKFKEQFISVLLEQLFTNLTKIENEII